MIRLTRPVLDDVEARAVRDVLATGMLVQGEQVQGFENDVATWLSAHSRAGGAVHTVAVANGTAALELCLLAAGVGPADEVLVPAVTWPSPGNAVAIHGAIPVLVDVELDTFNIDSLRIHEHVTSRTTAVIAIDQFGVPADAPALRRALGSLTIIEDAACALGSSLGEVACGLLGDLGTYSFHPRKVITTGEGGMVITRDVRHAEAVRALRNHGQTSPGVFAGAGPNERMTEIQGAIGRVQMTRLEQILSSRRAMADEMRRAVRLHWQQAPAGARVNHQTLGFVLPEPSHGTRAAARAAVVAALRSDGIEAGALSHGLHRLPQFARLTVNSERHFPVADLVADGGIAVPLHPGMTATDVAVVIDGLRRHAAWAIGRSVTVP